MKRLISSFVLCTLCALFVNAAPQILLDENGNECQYFGTYKGYIEYHGSAQCAATIYVYTRTVGTTTFFRAVFSLPTYGNRTTFYPVSPNQGGGGVLGRYSHCVTDRDNLTYYFNL